MEVETLIQPQKEVAADPIRVILNPTNLESKQSSHFSVYRSSTCPSSDSSGGARQRLLIRDILTETRGKKGQLTVVDFAEAQYIEFDDSGRSVIGVWVRHMNTGLMECLCPSNGGEVVLCSGVFESPRILHTSILRQREAVSRAVSTTQKQTSAISQVPSKLKGTIWDPLVSDLMGESLQDHLLVPLMFLASQRWMNPAILNEPSSSSKHSGPSNGIHGWIYLNDEGVPCNLNSSHAIPRYVSIYL